MIHSDPVLLTINNENSSDNHPHVINKKLNYLHYKKITNFELSSEFFGKKMILSELFKFSRFFVIK